MQALAYEVPGGGTRNATRSRASNNSRRHSISGCPAFSCMDWQSRQCGMRWTSISRPSCCGRLRSNYCGRSCVAIELSETEPFRFDVRVHRTCDPCRQSHHVAHITPICSSANGCLNNAQGRSNLFVHPTASSFFLFVNVQLPCCT
jgi:hypothetical protein